MERAGVEVYIHLQYNLKACKSIWIYTRLFMCEISCELHVKMQRTCVWGFYMYIIYSIVKAGWINVPGFFCDYF